MDFARALLDELTAAQSGIIVNTAQCELLYSQAVRVVDELRRLPPPTQDFFAQQGTFALLHETLRAATAFCGEFEGRHVLRHVLTYKRDAGRFDELMRRFADVIQAAGFASTVDEHVWCAAQEADNVAWETKLDDIETWLTSNVGSHLDSVASPIQRLFGLVDSTPQQQEETAALLESLRQLQSIQKNKTAALARSGDSIACLLDGLDFQEVWEINPFEVKFDQKKDEFGDIRRVSLGEGAFGEVLRGWFLVSVRI
jgi:hypothetical protein